MLYTRWLDNNQVKWGISTTEVKYYVLSVLVAASLDRSISSWNVSPGASLLRDWWRRSCQRTGNSSSVQFECWSVLLTVLVKAQSCTESVPESCCPQISSSGRPGWQVPPVCRSPRSSPPATWLSPPSSTPPHRHDPPLSHQKHWLYSL